MSNNDSQSTDTGNIPLSGPLKSDDVMDLLSSDDEGHADEGRESESGKEKEREAVKEEEEEEEDGEEGEEGEGEEGEGDEEEEIPIGDEAEERELQLITPVKKKAIEKEYPGFFKKFPYMEVAYFRDKQFTEMFGTVKDAQVVKDRADRFDEFEASLMNGSTKDVLDTVKDSDPEAFKKIVDNYLDTLYEVSKEAHNEVISDVISRAIQGMVKEARRLGDKEGEKGEILMEAAVILNQFMFGKSEFVPPKQRGTTPESNAEAQRLAQERESFFKERFEIAQGDLTKRLDNRIRSTIERHIDENNQMSPYVKKNAIRDAEKYIEDTIGRDRQFKTRVLDPLWKQAFGAKFSKSSMDKIEQAYASKASSIIRDAIKKARREALKDTRGNREERDRRGPLPSGRSSASSRSSSSGGKKVEIPKGMSSRDFLMGD